MAGKEGRRWERERERKGGGGESSENFVREHVPALINIFSFPFSLQPSLSHTKRWQAVHRQERLQQLRQCMALASSNVANEQDRELLPRII